MVSVRPINSSIAIRSDWKDIAVTIIAETRSLQPGGETPKASAQKGQKPGGDDNCHHIDFRWENFNFPRGPTVQVAYWTHLINIQA